MDSFDNRVTKFAEVLLPLNLSRSFTYRIPFEWNEKIIIGQRVSVPFGKNKIYAGIVYAIGSQPPKGYEAKYILDIIDDEPIVDALQLKFWNWLSAYYLCSIGQVLSAALPAGLKMEGESKLMLNPHYDGTDVILDDREQLLINALNQQNLSLSQAAALIKTGIHKYVKSLYLKGLICLKEDISENYSEKKELYLRIAPEFHEEKALHALFDQLEKPAAKQLDCLMRFIADYGLKSEASKKELIKKTGHASSVNTLLKKSVFLQESRAVSRLTSTPQSKDEIKLSSEQERAYAEISSAFEKAQPVLLHGVTSSGKTLIYTQLIREALGNGEQVLYLLPEIALTSQLVDRLAAYFGEEMLVSHSKFSKDERVEIYQRVNSGESLLILGTRSAIFQPFKNLGLIIIDEEHESSFKQFDPAPRFHARDAAIYLGNLMQSRILLGSATPAFETYYNAQQGKYALVELHERFDGAKMPDINIVDMLQQRKQKRNRGIFSDTLIETMIIAKKEEKQSILFQNKKGYVPVIECSTCAWSPKCVNCDITLTYYKYQNNLRCHYCGFTRPPVNQCASCGSKGLELIGYGTERVEDELLVFEPELRAQRMDYNTTRTKTAHKKIIDRFSKHEIDVLIGTQMVAKGLDFDKVRIVGILNADHLLNFPDFRAHERAYQLMVQVSGRAGRREEQGQVYIQSAKAGHEVLRQITEGGYTDFYTQEIAEREQFQYPPFSRLIRITLKHKDPLELHKAAKLASDEFKVIFGQRILGPEKPYVSKIRNMYLINFLLKIENRGPELLREKKKLVLAVQRLDQTALFRQVRVVIDVDPY